MDNNPVDDGAAAGGPDRANAPLTVSKNKGRMAPMAVLENAIGLLSSRLMWSACDVVARVRREATQGPYLCSNVFAK